MRTQWLALSAALVVLTGVIVAWALSTAADRVQVVQLAQPVRAGHELTIDDLVVTEVAFDAGVTGLVPASSLHELVGRLAAIDLEAGALVQVGMWRATPNLAAGEESVGVVLKPGRAPSTLAQGDVAVAASADPAVSAAPVPVRVLDATAKDDGTLMVNLAVPVAQAVKVAQLAASEQLVLVVRAPGGAS
ncbi:MAG: SAF domain-containing protein [Actinomycetota bacterium]